MATLTDDDREAALAHLNEICPDTFDEGEFAPWTFTGLQRIEDLWTLSFDNANGSDQVEFTYTGGCVDDGIVTNDGFEAVNTAIQAWESEAAGYE